MVTDEALVAATGGQAPSTSSMAVLAVSKRFEAKGGPVKALERVSLAAEPGQFVTLIGPSGCGKSTLFNIIAGLEEPSEGEIRLGGELLRRRVGRVAYMPQKDLLLPWRRVIDNTIIGLQLGGMSRADARRRAEPLLGRFGLEGFASAYPWQLSGGMRQRAAFLRTVILGRPAMLLDEPFGALDGLTRTSLQSWLLDVWGEFRTTVIFITHDVAEAVFLSDRVYVMTPRPGRIAAVVDIDLPRPRRLAMEEEDRFVELERRLRHELRGATGEEGA
jgi:ABC-type nitrate/sulfonate/bicarbonate transport system ATPase subunit